MTDARLQLAATLADLLAQENEALRRMDLAGAVALLPAKEAAVAALAANAVALSGPPIPPAAALGRRLTALASDNRVLLERAITVQTRIVGIVARAARPDTPRSYGAKGRQGPPSRTVAMALRTSV